ncbi:helix-turn-helix domain-containing protein [Sphingopyxis flava]|uniref:Helix-turn-helix n=1 Tax=Sphingopyxis flava TaxID=1507287 RepID=A0A1T4ZV45_9SPHN|nr:helix-turn-helix domain-containing protein [Sphingopyxis flava]SKB26631.1 Helix-turn-helix [Sphingopyxis flava]
MTNGLTLAETLKKARHARGLTQAELGARVGIPQSHISKIEKGSVDIKLSSLTEIARALDLEVTLVPRRALRAVESSVRAFGGADETSRAIAALDEQLELAERIERKFPELIETESFGRAVRSLRNLQYTPPAWRALDEALRPARELGKSLEAFAEATALARRLSTATTALRSLRNEAAHRPALPAPQRPAHRLDEEDDA